MSASTIWIAIGVISGTIAAFSLPYGFYLKSQEKNTKTPAEQSSVAIGKIEKSGDVIGRDKIVYDQRVIKPAKDTEQADTGKKIAVAKIKLKRYIDDYKLNIEEEKQSYFKESDRIASNMSGRGIGRSGVHIKAQMDHAIETKKKAEALFTKLTRNIEDVLLENFDSNLLSQIPSLREEYDEYKSLEQMNKVLYKIMEDNVKSWEVKIGMSINVTKNFTLK